jgi:hypothetical protein
MVKYTKGGGTCPTGSPTESEAQPGGRAREQHQTDRATYTARLTGLKRRVPDWKSPRSQDSKGYPVAVSGVFSREVGASR